MRNQSSLRVILSVFFLSLLGVLPPSLASAADSVIQKSQTDQRDYHYLVLENQLKVLLISDPKADKAAASLDVHVGSSDDPADREGLAHFLEHMLFLGTKKYPDASEYQAFISENGGSHNAYTSTEHTNYFFDIDASKLEPALDRFAQFFIAPLFDMKYVDRERNAVHSEYQAKIKDDNRRGYDVYRQLINPEHPTAKFSVGSLTTLADRPNDKVRDDLLDFYRQHYSSNQMTLVVLGKETLPQLQKMVQQRFSLVPLQPTSELENTLEQAEAIPSQLTVKPSIQTPLVPLFTANTLPIEVISQPIQDVRQMNMAFPLPSVKSYYQKKPLNYIGFLLGHEGKGSILSLLKQRGWAESLSAGGYESGAGSAVFYVIINLTEEGLKQREKIRSLVFYALDTIAKKGIEAWRYAEEQQVAQLAFQFRENGKAIQTVRELAANLHDYPAAEVMSGAYLYREFDAELIQQLLSQMTPDNLYVSTVFPGAETDQKTHYYQVPYKVMPLPKQPVKISSALQQQYHLPLKNPFIASVSTFYQTDKSLSKPTPVKLKHKEKGTSKKVIWAKQDLSFGVPKAAITLRIQSPLAAHSLQAAALSHLLLAIIQDSLNENSYPALIAGLSYSLTTNNRGFDINLQGYENKMDVLLEMVIRGIEQPVLSSSRFNNVKVELLRQLRNSKKQTPYYQVMQTLPVTLFKPSWSDEQIADVLEGLDLDSVKSFSRKWLQGSTVRGLFYGNIDVDVAARWEAQVSRLLQPGEQPVPPTQVVNLSVPQVSGRAPIKQKHISVDHNDKSVGLYVQGTTDTLEDQAKMVLLRQVLETDFYTQLRTEQQLGYIVFLTALTIKEVPGSLFMVQSPSTSVDSIKAAIEAFIQKSLQNIPDDLSVYQQSAATKLLEKPQTLSAQASWYWKDILKQDSSFSYRPRLVEAIKQVNSEQLRDYFKKTLFNQQLLLWFTADKIINKSVLPLFPESQAYYQYP